MIDPSQRPTARQLAAQSQGSEPMQIAGKPADMCPRCGAAMFVNGTQRLATRIERYVQCRNCKSTFVSRQSLAVLVREVGNTDDLSSSGMQQLTILRESA